MSDRAAVALAVAAALGAHLGGGPHPLVAALLGAVAVAARRPWLLCLAAALAAAGLADRSHAGIDPVGAGPWQGWVTLVDDPEPLAGGGVAAVVALPGGRRVEATAHGPAAWRLEDLLAGERVAVRGRLRPPPDDAPWLRARRIVGRIAVEQIPDDAPAAPAHAAANAVRRTLERGANGMPERSRSLLTGVVLGDDRYQPPEVADDFRAAGLSHLLAVSGQNVAYLLALTRPVLRWLPGRARVLGTLAVVAGFALLVRFEPSVLRAGAMAAVACVAAALGRPADGVRVLALAVTALLLVDPLLVESVGFGLSVGAAAGILLLGPRIAAAIGGPRPLAESLAVTVAATAGALPLLLAVFGPVPVATLPANLLAGPAAGPLIVWGLTGGLAAGLVDGWARALLQAPTRVLTWWLAEVANRCAALPLGELGPPAAVAVAGGITLLVLARRRSPPWRGVVRAAGAAVMAATLAAAAAAVPTPAPGRTDVARGTVLWWSEDGSAAVLGDGARPGPVLEGLRRAGARCVDVVAVDGGGRAARRAATALARRCPGALVAAPAGQALPGWVALDPDGVLTVGGVQLALDDGALAVKPARGAPARRGDTVAG